MGALSGSKSKSAGTNISVSESRQKSESESASQQQATSSQAGFSGIGPGAARQGLAGQAATAGGQALAQAQGIAARPGIQLNELGLQKEQQQAFGSALDRALNRFSGGAANRGQLSPLNTGAIAGSAARGAALELLPTISQNLAQRRGEPLQALAGQTQALGAVTGALGDVRTSEAQSSGDAFSRAIADAFSKSTSLGRSTSSSIGGGVSVGGG